ncbi:hypothetical protein [Arthrobacter sp. M4]|uniref:hypothetical protein n=1 Tax=Arthrobacter sp. M4 TaxID=218160 RepID=UPI001CDB4CC4|nr:hypothetical protein [Arthrobacter sp. M4]MCA4133753.1 hypothetical protein [Arthrobacter sp. M4]
MKNTIFAAKSALAAVMVCGALAFSLAGCGGSTTTPAGGTAGSSSSPSPTPTPTPTPKKYTAAELEAVVHQITDGTGASLKVISQKDVAASLEQVKALMSQVTAEPATCKDLAMAGLNRPVEGASIAMGLNQDAATGTSNALTLSSGLDKAVLDQMIAQSDQQLSSCATLKVTMQGVTSTVTTTKVAGVGSVPGTLAYRSDTKLSSGQRQSVIVAQVVKDDVLITATAGGGASEEAAKDRAGTLLDQAAALIK